MSKKLGQRCQTLLVVIYFTELSRVNLLSATVGKKITKKK